MIKNDSSIDLLPHQYQQPVNMYRLLVFRCCLLLGNRQNEYLFHLPLQNKTQFKSSLSISVISQPSILNGVLDNR